MASSFETYRAAIEARIEAQWAGQTPVQWADRPIAPPAGVWIQPVVVWGRAQPLTMGAAGAALNGAVGLVNVNVFDLAGRGKGRLHRTGDAVRAMLADVAVGGVEFDVPTGVIPVEPTEGRWVQANVSVTFQVRETV